MGVPEQLVQQLAAAGSADCFIETGTFHGGTTSWAAKHFGRVVTIEINPELSAKTASNLGHPQNVEFLVGDSAELLPKIASKLERPAVFWLDGHYCGPGTGDTSCECPIIAELEAAAASPAPIILIDDARCFLGPPPPPHDPSQWINIDQIFRFISKRLPQHTTTIQDDVIISVPSKLKSILDKDWLLKFDERYPSFQRQPPGVIRRVFQAILNRIK